METSRKYKFVIMHGGVWWCDGFPYPSGKNWSTIEVKRFKEYLA